MEKDFSMILLNDAEQKQITGGSDSNPPCEKAGDVIMRDCGVGAEVWVKLCVTIEAHCESQFIWDSEAEDGGHYNCEKYTLKPKPQP